VIEHKSEQLMQVALSNGWKAQLIPDIPLDGNVDEIVWNLYCIRDKQTMQVRYIGNRLHEATHTLHGEVSHPQYKGNVLKVLTSKPSLKKIVKNSNGNADEIVRSVPWVHDDPAILILQEVLGKEISWIRRIDGELCTATIERHSNFRSKFFRIYERNSTRFLEWTGVDGFHCVYLDAIIDVS
jgi:hypothetical protein